MSQGNRAMQGVFFLYPVTLPLYLLPVPKGQGRYSTDLADMMKSRCSHLLPKGRLNVKLK